ncbi:hypothetical protein [Lentibacillus jeotgali]|uniref:hypothetical protein n=1 Tax=Lentibacillus jeotgali TaxID=558169 RepID=UPI000262605D|nr:hypothetical protein [Lentibacillus jeotgali]
MRELIGECQQCGKNVYCENGFFDGVQENGKLLCNECADEKNRHNGENPEVHNLIDAIRGIITASFRCA